MLCCQHGSTQRATGRKIKMRRDFVGVPGIAVTVCVKGGVVVVQMHDSMKHE